MRQSSSGGRRVVAGRRRRPDASPAGGWGKELKRHGAAGLQAAAAAWVEFPPQPGEEPGHPYPLARAV